MQIKYNIFWIRVRSYFFTSLGSYKNWSLFLFAVLYIQKSRLLEIKMSFHIEFQHIISFKYLINIFTGSQSWNRQHHGQAIHPSPTEKLISMNLFKILCVVAWLILTSVVMEAVRGQKCYSKRTLWHFNSTFRSSYSASSACQKK